MRYVEVCGECSWMRTCWHRIIGFSAGLLFLVGCAQDEPGLERQDDVPRPTSDTLGACPTEESDETTPAAGCLDQEGRVVRP